MSGSDASRMTQVSATAASMGGSVTVVIGCRSGDETVASAAASRTLSRINAWAARLTRFDGESDLSILNRSPSADHKVGPTLARVLEVARAIEQASDGVVDVTLLAERLAAQAGRPSTEPDRQGRWRLECQARGALVRRCGQVLFDLDGVAKGWIADRALALLDRFPAALVDADGDIAVRDDVDMGWEIAIAGPLGTQRDVGTVRVLPAGRRSRLGVATSGTSIHRWGSADEGRHHLIDPASGQPARGRLVQATVVAGRATDAEMLAKIALIRGSATAARLIKGHGGAGVFVDHEGGVTQVGVATELVA
jgi:thiamine biosynthesis lipoprotein